MSDETKTAEQIKAEIAADEQKLAAISAAPTSPERKTVEEWAALKGFTSLVRVPDPKGRKPATMQKIPDWRFAAVKACNRWPIGLELSEAEFDAAASAALNVAVK
jgi:hypothetical protein